MRSSTVCSDTSSQITKSNADRNLAKVDVKLSACGSVRGKPSKTNPWPPCKRSQSSISSMMILSETRPPLRSTSAVSCPKGVPRSRSRRKIAPVEVTGIPKWRVIISAWVPFPEPGAPRRTSRLFTEESLKRLSRAARARLALSGKARTTSMSAATCEEQATPDSPNPARPRGCARFSSLRRCSSLTDRCGHARSSRLGETKNRQQRGMTEFFKRLLSAVKKKGDPGDHKNSDAHIKPHQRAAGCRLAANVSGTIERSAPNSAFSQKPVVMPLNQMRFHLAHGVKHHADNNQQAGAAEKLRCNDGHIQPLAEKTWQNRYQRQENRASKREPRHREIKKVSSRFSGPHSGNVTAVLFEIVGDLRRLKLCGDPEVTEEENHCREHDIMHPAGGKCRRYPLSCRAVSKSVLNDGRWKKKQRPRKDDRHHACVIDF